MCENNRQTKCSTLQFTNQLTVWMRPPWTATALRPLEGLWVLRCQRVWQLLNFYIKVFLLKISLTGQMCKSYTSRKGVYCSLPFLPATPLPWSQTLEGIFERTRHPSRALNFGSCDCFHYSDIKGHFHKQHIVPTLITFHGSP